MSTTPGIASGTHFHVKYGTKTTLLFLPADAEAFLMLFSSSASLLSGSTVQPQNTYSCILKVTGQARESQKRITLTSVKASHQCTKMDYFSATTAHR